MFVYNARRDNLRYSVRRDVDLPLQLRSPFPIRFQQIVMMFTQQTQIQQRRFTTLRPRGDVMSVAINCRTVATWKHTALVADMQRMTNISSDEPLFPAHIEHAGGAAKDHRQDACIARVLTELAGGELGAVGEAGAMAFVE
jgi:hypothetical protein